MGRERGACRRPRPSGIVTPKGTRRGGRDERQGMEGDRLGEGRRTGIVGASMAVKTHYDNLKVARNAPDDVIRAAYRSLVEKYHPSRNPSADAARITKILDEAYETLTDPVRRKNHDQWIAREERKEAMERAAPGAPPSPAPRSPFREHMDSFMAWARVNGRGQRLGVGALLLVAVAVIAVWQDQRGSFPNADAPTTTQPYNAAPVSAPAYVLPPVVAPKLTQPYEGSPASAAPTPPAYQRPNLSPKGFPWPTAAGYLKGFPKLATDGHSSVHVDNAQGDSDVMVKIVSTGGATAFPVRVFYIPAHADFTATKLPPGTYDVRFRTLADGVLSRSDTFNLEETPDATGVRYTRYELTLYTVANGNVQMHALNEKDF